MFVTAITLKGLIFFFKFFKTFFLKVGMLYKILAALHPIPIFKGTLFSKNSLGRNHNGNALGSQLLQIRGSLRLIDLKTCLIIGKIRVLTLKFANLSNFFMSLSY